MKEFTYVVNAQITCIVKKDDTCEPFTEAEKRNLAKVMKDDLGADDVTISEIKTFVRDLTEERGDETEQ